METAPSGFWCFLWSVPWSHMRTFYSCCSPWFQPVRMRRAPRKEATYGFGSKWPKNQQIRSFLVLQSCSHTFLESTILSYAYILVISTQVFSITLVDFADRSCCGWTAVVLTRCMWPGLDVPTLAGVKGHEQESRCQVPFRTCLACLVFFSSNLARRPPSGFADVKENIQRGSTASTS